MRLHESVVGPWASDLGPVGSFRPRALQASVPLTLYRHCAFGDCASWLYPFWPWRPSDCLAPWVPVPLGYCPIAVFALEAVWRLGSSVQGLLPSTV